MVFDRTRENLPKSKESFAETVNHSLNQTFVRSITTVTVLLSLLAVLVFGGSSIRDFCFSFNYWCVFCGAYSSLFVASPFEVYMEQWQKRK